jgi:hypothetical protein
MLSSYRRNGSDYEVNSDERVVFEGLWVSSSIGTGEVIIKMVEEQIVSNRGDKRLVNIFIDSPIHLSL